MKTRHAEAPGSLLVEPSRTTTHAGETNAVPFGVNFAFARRAKSSARQIMNPEAEVNMNRLKHLWIRIVQFADLLDRAIDDRTGDDQFALATRIDNLEHDLEHLKRQQHS